MAQIIRPQKGKQELMLNIDADVIFTGGSAGAAKSYTLLMRMLRYLNDDKFNAIYFRRNSTQLKGQGGLWQEAQGMYRQFGCDFKQGEMLATFPSGASAKFSHLDHENDRFKHQGLQYSAVFWDELCHFTEEQFLYLCSRLRSGSDENSFTMASMNPDPDSWALKYIMPFLDEEGYFNNDMLGKLRYFVTVQGQPVFADTREELISKYPENCYVYDPIKKERVLVPPKSFTFVGATIFDNPILIEKNPNYLAELQSLPEIERARLLHGNWFAREQASSYFNRNWLVKRQEYPTYGKSARAWDLASMEPSEKEMFPDFSACVKMLKTREGEYVILGDFSPECGEDENNIGRFRKRIGIRDKVMLSQAKFDGHDTDVVLPVDPGASGKVAYQNLAKMFVEEGFIVKQDPAPSNKSKVSRFSPFASACENGLVSIVEDSFPNQKILELFYKELEAFNGERSTRQRKDDWVDATASAFNYLSAERVKKLVVRNQQSSPSLASNIREGLR